MKMLHYWLSNGSGSVEELVKAVEQLGQKNLANKIAKEYAGRIANCGDH